MSINQGNGLTYADGTPAPPSDLDLIAKAFGFHSAQHLDAVLSGQAPSSLQSLTHWSRKRAS